MFYGYEISEAVLEHYGFYKGADKDRLLDMAEILEDLYEVSGNDRWVRKSLKGVVRKYYEEYEGKSDREFLQRFEDYLE